MKPTRRTRRAVLQTIGGTTVLGAGTVAAVSPAAAQPPVSGSGTGKIRPVEITVIRETETNRFEERVLEGEVIGTLDGSFVQDTTGKVHKKSGRVVFQGTLTFTGEIGDCGEGTINLRLSGRGQTQPEEGPGPVTEASVRVVNQAQNTIDVTGQGTVFQEGEDLEYDIQYNC